MATLRWSLTSGRRAPMMVQLLQRATLGGTTEKRKDSGWLGWLRPAAPFTRPDGTPSQTSSLVWPTLSALVLPNFLRELARLLRAVPKKKVSHSRKRMRSAHKASLSISVSASVLLAANPNVNTSCVSIATPIRSSNAVRASRLLGRRASPPEPHSLPTPIPIHSSCPLAQERYKKKKKKEIPQCCLPGSSSHRSIKIHKNLYFFFLSMMMAVCWWFYLFFFEKLP